VIRRIAAASALVCAVTLFAGCRPRAAAPPPPPPPAARQAKIGIVDLEAVLRAHPRWPELEQINAAIQRIDVEMASATILPPPARPSSSTAAGLKKTLDQEAAALRRSIDQELTALRAESRRRLDSLAAQIRAEQQSKFQTASKQITAEAESVLDAKENELQAKLRTGELAIMEEYSYPILNLRLRAEVAGLRSEDEARQILRQIQLLQSEREARIADLRESLGEEFETFRRTKEAEVNDRLKALQETLNTEFRDRMASKQAELAAALAKTAAERQGQFQRQMAERQRRLIATAESQLRSQQRVVVTGLGERVQRLQAQRVALLDQRQRLQDTILADVRIEVASLAAQQGIDTVLTHLVVNVSAADITGSVVQRLRQR
jgi:Skp family chaperone for outer membrane proteins